MCHRHGISSSFYINGSVKNGTVENPCVWRKTASRKRRAVFFHRAGIPPTRDRNQKESISYIFRIKKQHFTYFC